MYPRHQIGLSTSQRIRRGFNRLGIAAAVIVLLIAGLWSVAVVGDDWRRQNSDYDQFACLLKAIKNNPIEAPTFKYVATGKAHTDCGYFSEYAEYQSLAWVKIDHSLRLNGKLLVRKTGMELIQATISSVLLATGLTILAGVLSFAFFAILGWIFAGFARD